MATELAVQSERAFQKQPHIFLNHKAQSGKSNKKGKGGSRWYKDVGLGFRTPKNAIDGNYIGMPVPERALGAGLGWRDGRIPSHDTRYTIHDGLTYSP